MLSPDFSKAIGLDAVPLVSPENPMLEKHYVVPLGIRAFNPALIEYANRRFMAWRTGWQPAEVWIGTLTERFEIKDPVLVNFSNVLPAAEPDTGFEDSRLFVYEERLWISFTYLRGSLPRMGLARLDSDFQPDECWIFEGQSRRAEKNWQFFSHDGTLLAVYSISPHVVGAIGECGFSKLHEQEHGLPWPHGDVRGGAPPVRIGDEYFSFFHDRSPHAEYRTGFYAFAAKPPFRITRWPRGHCLVPAGKACAPESGTRVIYPAGAIFREGEWLLAYGWNDSHCCLARFDHAELVASLDQV